MKTIVRGRQEIKDAQTIPYPDMYEVRKQFDYVNGWIAAIYNHRTRQWYYSYFNTRDEAIQHWDDFKRLLDQFPEVFGSWFEYSEMVVYGSMSRFNGDWSLHFIIVDD